MPLTTTSQEEIRLARFLAQEEIGASAEQRAALARTLVARGLLLDVCLDLSAESVKELGRLTSKTLMAPGWVSLLDCLPLLSPESVSRVLQDAQQALNVMAVITTAEVEDLDDEDDELNLLSSSPVPHAPVALALGVTPRAPLVESVVISGVEGNELVNAAGTLPSAAHAFGSYEAYLPSIFPCASEAKLVTIERVMKEQMGLDFQGFSRLKADAADNLYHQLLCSPTISESLDMSIAALILWNAAKKRISRALSKGRLLGAAAPLAHAAPRQQHQEPRVNKAKAAPRRKRPLGEVDEDDFERNGPKLRHETACVKFSGRGAFKGRSGLEANHAGLTSSSLQAAARDKRAAARKGDTIAPSAKPRTASELSQLPHDLLPSPGGSEEGHVIIMQSQAGTGGSQASTKIPTATADKIVAVFKELAEEGRTPTLAAIDEVLHDGNFKNSTGKAWPSKSDGGVIARVLGKARLKVDLVTFSGSNALVEAQWSKAYNGAYQKAAVEQATAQELVVTTAAKTAKVTTVMGEASDGSSDFEKNKQHGNAQ